MNIQCFFSISKHITLIGKPFTRENPEMFVEISVQTILEIYYEIFFTIHIMYG